MYRTQIVRGATVLLALTALFPARAAAQERTETGQERAAAARVDSLVERVTHLEALIDSLRAELARALEARGEAAPPGAGEAREAETDELAALREAAEAAAAEAEAAEPEPDAEAAPREGRTRNLQLLNPEISITGDIVGGLAAPSEEGSSLRAVPREFEFSFQSALDPYTRTKIFVTRHEDFEIAGLGHGHEEEAGHEEGGFEIEEGYMYWVGLPAGLSVKLGKFRHEIGLYNRWHTHALFEVDRPLPTVAFLGEEGLVQTGLSVALPSFGLGPATQSAWFEVAQSASDALFETGNDPAYLGRLQSFFDLSPTAFLQLGATGVYADNDAEELDLRSQLLGIDAYFRWTPRSQYRDLSLKAEWYFAEKESPGEEASGDGGYVQANARLGRRWTLGLRGDYLDGFGPEPEIFQLVPSVTWWQSEWVRLRLQYNLVMPEGPGTDHTLLLQTVWAVGPHKHESY